MKRHHHIHVHLGDAMHYGTMSGGMAEQRDAGTAHDPHTGQFTGQGGKPAKQEEVRTLVGTATAHKISPSHYEITNSEKGHIGSVKSGNSTSIVHTARGGAGTSTSNLWHAVPKGQASSTGRYKKREHAIHHLLQHH